MVQENIVIEMRNITKQFGTFKANDNINLQVRAGEIHALLGENGAGKSTLMNVLSGLLEPTSGEILMHGKEVKITSPTKANQLGIGMVHQHMMLVPSLTVAENLVLGIEQKKGECSWIRRKQWKRQRKFQRNIIFMWMPQGESVTSPSV